MINTEVYTAAGECARLLAVVHVAFVLVWWFYHVLTEPAAPWMVLVCVAVLLRVLGPVGAGLWRPLFTACVLLSLLFGAIALRMPDGRLASLALLLFLGLKLATETIDRRRIISQQDQVNATARFRS